MEKRCLYTFTSQQWACTERTQPENDISFCLGLFVLTEVFLWTIFSLFGLLNPIIIWILVSMNMQLMLNNCNFWWKSIYVPQKKMFSDEFTLSFIHVSLNHACWFRSSLSPGSYSDRQPSKTHCELEYDHRLIWAWTLFESFGIM